MEDRLISLETAVLAKNKEFNGLKIFDPNHEFLYPTQSLLQKWLREEHKIIVLVDTFLGNFICKVNNVIVSNNKTGNILKYTTYEEALEQGLIEGLNRI